MYRVPVAVTTCVRQVCGNTASSAFGRSAAKSKAAKAPRKALSLKEKHDVIETSKKNPGLAARALVAKFGCGSTYINSILSVAYCETIQTIL